MKPIEWQKIEMTEQEKEWCKAHTKIIKRIITMFGVSAKYLGRKQ